MKHNGYEPQLERRLQLLASQIVYDLMLKDDLYPGDEGFRAGFIDNWETKTESRDWDVFQITCDEVEFIPKNKSIKVPI